MRSECTKITLKEKNILEQRIADMGNKLATVQNLRQTPLDFQKVIWMLAQRSHEKFVN